MPTNLLKAASVPKVVYIKITQALEPNGATWGMPGMTGSDRLQAKEEIDPPQTTPKKKLSCRSRWVFWRPWSVLNRSVGVTCRREFGHRFCPLQFTRRGKLVALRLNFGSLSRAAHHACFTNWIVFRPSQRESVKSDHEKIRGAEDRIRFGRHGHKTDLGYPSFPNSWPIAT